jgi:hypothetical protein
LKQQRCTKNLMLAHASDMPLTRQQSTSAKMHDRPLNETIANLTP